MLETEALLFFGLTSKFTIEKAFSQSNANDALVIRKGLPAQQFSILIFANFSSCVFVNSHESILQHKLLWLPVVYNKELNTVLGDKAFQFASKIKGPGG